MALKTTVIAVAVALIVGACAGVAVTWKLTHPDPTKWPVNAAPSVRLRDGALVAERRIDTEAKPKQVLPAGSKAARVMTVTALPRINGADPQGKDAPAAVTLDLTLTDDNRAVWSSPDPNWTVGTATDTWVRPPVVPHQTRNTLLISYNWITKDATAGYAHHLFSIGPVKVEVGGIAIWQDRKLGLNALAAGRW